MSSANSVSHQRYLKEGKAWRLGWDRSAHYCGLIGGLGWAMELTAQELEDFHRLALQLAGTMAAMGAELMDAEQITCEAETERIWLEAAGFSDRYGLRILLLTGRQGEGTWEADAVPELLQALQGLTVF
ncbi:DUF1818 domain-containing protein [filamentous cyanobacterium CCP5]|nr:DUF1818 domain-containing protein [filamentous cyanobacterium CCP5]